MAGSFNDYLEKALLDHVFGNTSTLAKPATLYVALYTVAPTDAGGGTEVTGNAYARVAVTNNAANWPAATGTTPTTKSNGATITFPQATPGNWGTVVAFAILDSNGATNFLCWGDLTASKAIDAGDTAYFDVSGITITLD